MSGQIVYGGVNGTVYYCNNVMYDIAFDPEWALTHYPDTGPHDCGYCAKNGMYNNTFIGYCKYCAPKYHGTRGHRGFVGLGAELDADNEKSATKTYLNGITLAQVGYSGESRGYSAPGFDAANAKPATPPQKIQSESSDLHRKRRLLFADQYTNAFDSFQRELSFSESD